MAFKRRKVAAALAYVVGAGTAAMLLAAAPAVAQDMRIDVTGSNIKRIDGEGPAPVEIITREQISKTGATSINELLKFIPAIDVFDQGELASNSPAGSGTGQIRMRGLSETATLVLLNGRRLPVNALYDSSGAGAAVDINMIPVSLVERIEILKDGGSAIYGADALAGVINIITRKNYTGIETALRYGISSEGDGEEWGVTLAGGFGDLDKDGYNLMASFDYFKRDPIYRKDRDISKSVDFRRFGAGDYRSSFSPYGNLVDDDFAFTGEQVKPCPPENLTNGRCRYDFNASLLTAYNGADRWSGMLIGSAKVGKDMVARGQLIYSEAEDTFEAHPVPDLFITSAGQYYYGRFMQGGPRITDRKSTLFDGNASLEGTTKWFDWDIAAGYGESKVTNNDKNYYNADLWYPALEAGLIDATVDTNDPALVESLKVTPKREGKSSVGYFDYRARGDAWALPAGTVRWAVGGSFWREKLEDTPDELSQQGLVVGSIQQAAVSADRNAYAVYGEVSVPILKNLELQGALRYDHYSDASRTSPKIAVLWNPIQQLAFRASYTESFRVPSLKQLYGAAEQGAANLSDEECVLLGYESGCGIPYYQVQGSNVDLKPEKGKTFGVGAIADLGPFSASVDWWRIELRDQITQPTISTAISQGLYGRDSNGQLLIYQNLLNVAESETEGIDIDLRLRFVNTKIGTLTFRNATTYYLENKNREEGESSWNDYNGTYALPEWRNVFAAGLEYAQWSGNVIVRTVGDFSDSDQPLPHPEGTRSVSSHTEWDLTGAWEDKAWKVDFGIRNLFDEQPPFSAQNAGSNAYTQMGFAELYTSRGRFFFGSVRYKFR